jgi:hypothetical protein
MLLTAHPAPRQEGRSPFYYLGVMAEIAERD